MNIKLYPALLGLVICATGNCLKAQDTILLKESRIYTSADMAIGGPQCRVAYDFYTIKGNCFGFSIAQLGGLKQMDKEKTVYYDFEDIRLNLSFRYTKVLFVHPRYRYFSLFQAGISYNTNLSGEVLILPSIRAGAGVDVLIYKSTGIRLEGGIGSPYFVSVGYFFSI